MRLTRKKALEITRELWQWLAQTGNKYKFEWSGWETYGEMESDCALCEYTSRSRARHEVDYECKLCPLWGAWVGEDVKTGEGGCGQPKSPFERWDFATSPEFRKKYAKQIVDLCDNALAKPQ